MNVFCPQAEKFGSFVPAAGGKLWDFLNFRGVVLGVLYTFGVLYKCCIGVLYHFQSLVSGRGCCICTHYEYAFKVKNI